MEPLPPESYGPLVNASSINQYFRCARQWRYSKEGNLPKIEVDDRAMLLGSNFHDKIIPEYFRATEDRPTARDIDKVARTVFETFFDSSLESVKKDAEEILANFIIFEQHRLKTWQTYKPEFIEKTLVNDKFGGSIDFYGEETILDWKTGNVPMLTEGLMRQGMVYKILLEDNGYKVKTMKFVVLSMGRVIELPLITRGWIEEERRSYLDHVKNGDFPQNFGPLCPSCPYALRCWSEGRSLWQ